MGMRSWGGYAAVQAAGVGAGGISAEANEGTLAFAMVETQEALDNVDAIAATPGLDGLFIGPNDLGISLGHGLNADLTIPKLDAAIRKIGAAAAKNGLIAGAFGGNPTNCNYFAERGFRFIVAVTEVGLMRPAPRALHRGNEADLTARPGQATLRARECVHGSAHTHRERREAILDKLVDMCLAAGPIAIQTDKYFTNTAGSCRSMAMSR